MDHDPFSAQAIRQIVEAAQGNVEITLAKLCQHLERLAVGNRAFSHYHPSLAEVQAFTSAGRKNGAPL